MLGHNGNLHSLRDVARHYLRQKVYPIPVLPRGKRCVEPAWENLRVTEEDIDRLFHEGGNIGVLLGEPSGGLIDCDLDCQEARAAASLLLPATELIGGRESAPDSHYWFVVDQPPRKASTSYYDPVTRTKLLELRSTGGMTVIAPSVYGPDPEKGHPAPERCVWAKHGEPAHIGIDGLRAVLDAVAAAALLGRYWPGHGSRHDAALALAGGLLRAGRSIEWVEKFVEAVAAAAGDGEIRNRLQCVADTHEKLKEGVNVVGWPRLEKILGERGRPVVTQVIGWLGVKFNTTGRATIGPSKPAPYVPIPPYVPFPTDCLPEPWDRFVREGAKALRCDEALIALPLMAVLSGAIGNTRRVHLGAEWFEPAVLWTCPIAESGGMKTSAAELSTGLVRARQKKLVKQYKDAVKEYRRAMADYRNAEPDKRGDEPEKPTLKRVVVSDITIEKLAGLHDDNRRGLLVARDELAGWVGSFTRYKGKAGGTDEPNWLSAHRGDAIIVDRKTGDKPSIFVPHAATSITGGIQPGTLRRLAAQDLFESGLIARIIFAMPPRTPKTWSDDEIAPATKYAAEQSLNGLYELEAETDDEGDLCPKVVKLSREARARLKLFVNQWGVRQYEAEGERAAALAKLEALPGRWALIHHTVLRAGTLEDTDPISLESLEAGIRLAEWCANEAERVYSALAESSNERDTRRLVELVARLAGRHGGRVTVKVLQRGNQRKYRTADTAKADLERLVGLGLGRWEETPEPTDRGRPTTSFILELDPGVTCDWCDENTPEEGGDDEPPTCDDNPNRPDDPNDPPPPTSDVSANDDGQYGESETSGEGISSHQSHVTHDAETENEPSAPVDAVREYRHTPSIIVTQAPAELSRVLTALRTAPQVGVDTETLGLSHDRDKVRLLSLATPSGTFLIDLFAVDPSPLWPALAAVELVGHNLGFDLPFLMRLGFVPGRVADTMLASQILHAGDRTIRHGLKDLTARHLNQSLDKELQRADWSGPLSPEMLRYAALDAEVPLVLWEQLTAELQAANLTATCITEMEALPALAWATFNGVGFDRPAWQALANDADASAAQLAEALDRLCPNAATLTATTNWNSPEQIIGAFAQLGIALDSTDDDALAGIDHPLAEAVREYRSAAKLTGTYGANWLKHARNNGRVYANWKQIGAGASGRMSCKEPNLQQLPRDPRYRKCFIAPPGRSLVKADYSQIELRIAAKLTGDGRMLDAYRQGDDLHTLTARALLGKLEVTKADRQLAKAINFGLLYGMGAKNLRVYARSNYGVSLTEAEAESHRTKFFQTYTGLRKWHRSTPQESIETRTLTGRRRIDVTRFSEKLNTPVQGTGADGLKRALALLWQRRDTCPDAFPVLLVHDEIVVECDEHRVEETAVWLRDAMKDGMAPIIDPIPVEVEVSAARTWGG